MGGDCSQKAGRGWVGGWGWKWVWGCGLAAHVVVLGGALTWRTITSRAWQWFTTRCGASCSVAETSTRLDSPDAIGETETAACRSSPTCLPLALAGGSSTQTLFTCVGSFGLGHTTLLLHVD